jgi:hypothetical protein
VDGDEEKRPRAEFDSEFEPCEFVIWPGRTKCGSTHRYAELRSDSLKRPQVAFLCDQGHRCIWDGRGQWIPLDIFEPGGMHDDMFVRDLFPGKPRTRPVSLEIKEPAQHRHRTAKACAVCDAPPFAGGRRDLLFWLNEHRPTFFRDDVVDLVRTHFQGMGVDYHDNWYGALPPLLVAKIEKHLAEARLEPDHGIPVAILRAIQPELTTAEINVACGAFTFPLCKRCNRAKSKSLEDLEVLSERFARQYWNGNRDLAMRDPSWAHISSLYMKALRYSRRAANAENP